MWPSPLSERFEFSGTGIAEQLSSGQIPKKMCNSRMVHDHILDTSFAASRIVAITTVN